MTLTASSHRSRQTRRHLARQLYEDAANGFEQALGLWRGRVLQDTVLSATDAPEIGRLEESRLVAIEERNEAALLCGRHEQLLTTLASLCRDHPFRERLWSQRMRALYGSGRQTEALRAFADLRRLLSEELGIEPSQELRDLETSMLLQRPELERQQASETSPKRSGPPRAVVATAPSGVDRLLDAYPTATLLDESDAATVVSFAAPSDAVRAALALHLDDGSSRRTLLHYGPDDEPGWSAPLAVVEAKGALRVVAEGGLMMSGPLVDTLEGHMPAGIGFAPPVSTRVRGSTRWVELRPVTHPDLPEPGSVRADVATDRGLLPASATSFVGRLRELEQVADMVRLGRVVTLTGAGGVGKTRLATEVAARVAARFQDEVWFVDLAAVARGDGVIAAIADTLGLEAGAVASSETVISRVGGQRLMLILDNCEHVREEAAAAAAAIVAGCSEVRILTTSRVRLGLPDEAIWPIGSLDLVVALDDGKATFSEVAECDAVRLFCERANAAASTFVLSEANAPDVLRLCSRVDGLPLALELAAARVRVATPAQIADRLGDALRLLADEGGDGRHASVRAALDWSYELLTPDDQRLLARLAVFPGSFSLEACEALAELDCLDEIGALDSVTPTGRPLASGDSAWGQPAVSPARDHEGVRRTSPRQSVRGRQRSHTRSATRLG